MNLLRSFASENYLNGSTSEYDFYFRKHNPLVMYDSVANDSSRLARLRNFNDFAAYVFKRVRIVNNEY